LHAFGKNERKWDHLNKESLAGYMDKKMRFSGCNNSLPQQEDHPMVIDELTDLIK
jgi:hypothetical protein